MSMMSVAAGTPAVAAQAGDTSFKIILMVCGLGLLASFGLMAHGVDLGAALM